MSVEVSEERKKGWEVAEFPADDTLASVLSRMLREKGLVKDEAVVVSREKAGRYSTYPNEVVTCRVDDGTERRLLCKYAKGHCHSGFGHRRGLRYETLIYRDVLEPLQMSTPRYYGCHADEAAGEHWLVMEYLGGGRTVNKGPQPASICNTARWIGEFNARCAVTLSADMVPSFIQYDRDYYLGWGRRTLEFTASMHAQHPWLPDLCRHYESVVDQFLTLPRTLIHGEYTVHNVVLHGEGIVSPIDWESAAYAFPEIDLAIITDGTWTQEVQDMCVEQYRQARWATAADVPTDFAARLRLAQLYNHMRWLGNRPKDSVLPKNAFRFAKLQAVGEQLSLI